MSVDTHRQRAELARRLAAGTADDRLKQRLQQLAVQYDAEAAAAAEKDERAGQQE
jgi:hypothetical protein